MLDGASVTSPRTWRRTGPLLAESVAPAGRERLPEGTVRRTPPEKVVAFEAVRLPLDSVSWIPLPAVAESAAPSARSTTRSCSRRPMLPAAARNRLPDSMTFDAPPTALTIEPPAAVRKRLPGETMPPTRRSPESCCRAMGPVAVAAVVVPMTIPRTKPVGVPSVANVPIPVWARRSALSARMLVPVAAGTIAPAAVTFTKPWFAVRLPSAASPVVTRSMPPAVDVTEPVWKTSSRAVPTIRIDPVDDPLNMPPSPREILTGALAPIVVPAERATTSALMTPLASGE